MKYLIALLTLIIGCTTIQPVVVPTHETAAAVMESQTVALVGVVSGGEIRPYCSGVWVNTKLILTANHCVSDDELGDVIMFAVKSDVFAPGQLEQRKEIQSHSGRLLARDEAHDLALIYVAGAPPVHSVALLSMSEVLPGQRVQAMGTPIGCWFSYSSGDVGRVAKISTMGDPMVFIQTTAPISPGSSGGGLFNEAGELIGIAHAVYTRGTNLGLFVHYQYAHALIRSNS